ncbi:MAG: FecR family protein [Tannerellaceae bacterium]|nr:FecR family protein [Tannerellaceae bacterium]
MEWLQQKEENKKQFMQLRDIWLASTPIPHAGSGYTEQAFQRFIQQTKPTEKIETKKHSLWFTRIAAAVILSLICLGGGYWLGTDRWSKIENAVVMNHFIMGKESKGSITLPDGSIAWLNAESELTYPENFSASERKVQLKGEGYFQVKEDKKRPFWVETGDIQVEVLGTWFDVKNYENRNITETTLLSGSVAVYISSINRRLTLKPNEKFVWNKNEHSYSVDSVTGSDYILWTNDRLVMTNERLSDILFRLERWYNIEIKYDRNIPHDTRLSLTVRRESKEEIFKLLELIAPVKCKINEHNVMIHKK